MRKSLAMTVAQLQDELHSKNEELVRSRLETQKAIQDIASLKQVPCEFSLRTVHVGLLSTQSHLTNKYFE